MAQPSVQGTEMVPVVVVTMGDAAKEHRGQSVVVGAWGRQGAGCEFAGAQGREIDPVVMMTMGDAAKERLGWSVVAEAWGRWETCYRFVGAWDRVVAAKVVQEGEA